MILIFLLYSLAGCGHRFCCCRVHYSKRDCSESRDITMALLMITLKHKMVMSGRVLMAYQPFPLMSAIAIVIC